MPLHAVCGTRSSLIRPAGFFSGSFQASGKARSRKDGGTQTRNFERSNLLLRKTRRHKAGQGSSGVRSPVAGFLVYSSSKAGRTGVPCARCHYDDENPVVVEGDLK